MQITPLNPAVIPAVINLFLQEINELRTLVTGLPRSQLNIPKITEDLTARAEGNQALVAVEDGEIVGYLGWFVFDKFREVARRTAYSPEWAHAAPGLRKQKIYQALYNSASQIWFEQACQVFVLTVLANDKHLESFWYWNGFGLLGVDAVSSDLALDIQPHHGFSIRKATLSDVDELIILDQEHWQHYSQPPTLMVPRPPRTATQLVAIIADSKSSIWLAIAGDTLAGMISFEAESYGATLLVISNTNIAITSAFVRPEFRRKKIASAILASAFQDFNRMGYQTCSVDYESVNPYAAAFWVKYFKPVCHSVMRVPEYHRDFASNGNR